MAVSQLKLTNKQIKKKKRFQSLNTHFSFSCATTLRQHSRMWDGDLTPCHMYTRPVLTFSSRRDDRDRKCSIDTGIWAQ